MTKKLLPAIFIAAALLAIPLSCEKEPVPQPKPEQAPEAPPPPEEAATFETADNVSNEEANKKGAKSLQIPLTDSTDAEKAVGTV